MTLTWFWNESINKIDSNEEEKDIGDVNRKNLKNSLRQNKLLVTKLYMLN